MAWDSTRPVPWRRLVREWLIYAAIMCTVVVLFMRDRPIVGIIAGLLASGPLYLLLGFVLAKFGYSRKTWSELRSQRPAAAPPATSTTPGARPKPAPTRRTGGGTPRRR